MHLEMFRASFFPSCLSCMAERNAKLHYRLVHGICILAGLKLSDRFSFHARIRGCFDDRFGQ